MSQLPDWTSGLAGTGEVLAFVGYLSPFGPDGYPEDAVLRLIDARSQPSGSERASDPLVEVRWPYTPGESGWSWVDLAPGARSAAVVTERRDGRLGVLLVTGLDTAEPRVQLVDTDQALRLG